MEQVCMELLANTDLSVKDVSAKLKLDSPYCFSTMFKRKNGISALAFMNRNRVGPLRSKERI